MNPTFLTRRSLIAGAASPAGRRRPLGPGRLATPAVSSLRSCPIRLAAAPTCWAAPWRKKLGGLLGTHVIVDNRAGATGTIGAAYVAKSAPDGYTLLGTSIGPQAIAPHLMGKLPYDPIGSFAPVVTIGTIPHILVMGANQPYRSVADLLAAAKAQPGKLAFASSGTGSSCRCRES